MAQAGGRPSRVRFPFLEEGGEPVEMGVRLLNDEDLDRCRLDAVQWVRGQADRLKIPGGAPALLAINADLLDRETDRMVVSQAFLDVETLDQDEPEKFFASPQQVRGLGTLTIDGLIQLYRGHAESVNPYHGLSEEEVSGLVDAMGKDSAQREAALSMWGLYDVHTLQSFVRTLVSLLGSSSTGK